MQDSFATLVQQSSDFSIKQVACFVIYDFFFRNSGTKMNPLIKQVLERFLKSQGRRILMRGAARLAAGLGAGK